MQRLRLLIAAAVLCFAPGCAKRAEMSSAPDMGYAGGAAAPEMPAAAPAYDSAEGDYAKEEVARERYAETESAPVAAGAANLGAPPPAKPAPSQPTVTRSEPKDAKPGAGNDAAEPGKEPQKQFARQIIYTADMTISCFKLDDAMKRAEALALESGGYVQTMSAGYFVLRIPAAKLRPVMDDLARLGVVESRSMQAQDVTQEYVDLQTRIRVLRETQSQLIALLKQARNVDEALNVRRSLDTITMELEQALGRLRMLENLIGFSTLTLRLSERGPQNAVPSSNDPFPWVDTLGVEATEWN